MQTIPKILQILNWNAGNVARHFSALKLYRFALSPVKVKLNIVQVGHQDSRLLGHDEGRIQLIEAEALPASCKLPLPEGGKLAEGQVIEDVPAGEIQKEEGNPALMFKFFHEKDLMLMDILQGKGIRGAFLGIEADRDALDCADVIHRALLVEIRFFDQTGLLIKFQGSDRGGDLLDQGQAVLLIFFIGAVDQFL